MPSYAIDEFRSHFRMTKTTFEVLAQNLAAIGEIPTGNRFGRNPIQLQKQLAHWKAGVHTIWPKNLEISV